MDEHAVFVHWAELELRPEVDLGAPGGAVTTALCGSWEHPPPCRWPHNNSEPDGPGLVTFRTVFVASADEEPTVRAHIEAALRAGAWRVLVTGSRGPTAEELRLGRRIGGLPEES